MSAKVLYWDVECNPMVAHVWGLRDQHLGLNQIIEQPRMFGFAAAWEDHRPRWFAEWDKGGRIGMLRKAHALMSEADVVVSYNGTSFDTKWLNGELAREGLTPPAPFKELDLYKVVRKNFRFPSYKLQYVSTALGLEGKLSTGGHQLWVDCMNGDTKARSRMARYCRRDTALLPLLKKKLQPWLPASINFALINGCEELACQKCGGHDLQSRGTAYTATRAYPQYRCNDCGGWTRDSRSIGGSQVTGVAR